MRTMPYGFWQSAMLSPNQSRPPTSYETPKGGATTGPQGMGGSPPRGSGPAFVPPSATASMARLNEALGTLSKTNEAINARNQELLGLAQAAMDSPQPTRRQLSRAESLAWGLTALVGALGGADPQSIANVGAQMAQRERILEVEYERAVAARNRQISEAIQRLNLGMQVGEFQARGAEGMFGAEQNIAELSQRDEQFNARQALDQKTLDLNTLVARHGMQMDQLNFNLREKMANQQYELGAEELKRMREAPHLELITSFNARLWQVQQLAKDPESLMAFIPEYELAKKVLREAGASPVLIARLNDPSVAARIPTIGQAQLAEEQRQHDDRMHLGRQEHNLNRDKFDFAKQEQQAGPFDRLLNERNKLFNLEDGVKAHRDSIRGMLTWMALEQFGEKGSVVLANEETVDAFLRGTQRTGDERELPHMVPIQIRDADGTVTTYELEVNDSLLNSPSVRALFEMQSRRTRQYSDMVRDGIPTKRDLMGGAGGMQVPSLADPQGGPVLPPGAAAPPTREPALPPGAAARPHQGSVAPSAGPRALGEAGNMGYRRRPGETDAPVGGAGGHNRVNLSMMGDNLWRGGGYGGSGIKPGSLDTPAPALEWIAPVRTPPAEGPRRTSRLTPRQQSIVTAKQNVQPTGQGVAALGRLFAGMQSEYITAERGVRRAKPNLDPTQGALRNDCSSFLNLLYREAGIDVGASTREMLARRGRQGPGSNAQITQEQSRTGDLVVFASGNANQARHAGLVERGKDNVLYIIHQSLAGKIVRQTLDSFLRSDARRFSGVAARLPIFLRPFGLGG